MKRKSLKGIGLNGKGQGANALLKGLRRNAEKPENAEHAQHHAGTVPDIPARTSEQFEVDSPVCRKSDVVAERSQKPIATPFQKGSYHLPTPLKGGLADKDVRVPRVAFRDSSEEGASPVRVKCTYYLDPDLEHFLVCIQAQYTLVEQTVEKSSIVNEALRRYLPQVNQEGATSLRQIVTRPKPEKRVKRTYYLESELERALDRVQARCRLEGQKIEKSVLMNEALRCYLPQVKEELNRSDTEQRRICQENHAERSKYGTL